MLESNSCLRNRPLIPMPSGTTDRYLDHAISNQLCSYLTQNNLHVVHQRTLSTTVNHQILLATLAKLGIADSVLSWFTSYLANCTIRSHRMAPCPNPARSSVPQGSVLGPLLFFTSHDFSYHFYTDDPQLFLSFPSSDSTLIATRISECLANVNTWTTAHHLKLNQG